MAEPDAIRLLDKAFDVGINFFDTAEMYAAPAQNETQGVSEEILGRWLRTKSRHAVVVGSKLNGAGDRPGQPLLPWIRGGYTALDRHHLIAACEASLRRLGTDYIDLYQPHWPDRLIPIPEQLAAMARLVESGKVRYFGLSNDTAWGTTRFCAEADAAGLPRVVSIQVAYNLLQRNPEHALAEVCAMERIGFIAFSPLAMGVLTGKYSTGERPAEARLSKFSRYGDMYLGDRMVEIADRYVAIARDHGLSPVKMAYAWVRQQPFVTSVLSSFSKPEQLQPFIESAQITLSPVILEQLDAIRQLHDARWNQFG